MTAVYLCGPINGCSDDEANGWRNQARRLLHGHELIDPMGRDYRGKEAENVEDIVDGDIADIEASEVVVAYCARPSWGTAMEIHAAHSMGIPVIAVVPDGPVSPWLAYHAEVVPTLQVAASAVLRESLRAEGA